MALAGIRVYQENWKPVDHQSDFIQHEDKKETKSLIDSLFPMQFVEFLCIPY